MKKHIQVVKKEEAAAVKPTRNMENFVTKAKLTEEQRKLVTDVLEDLYGEDGIFPKDTVKGEEFKEALLQEDDPYQIEALIELCQEYQYQRMRNETSFVPLMFAIMYDMWINHSAVWPVPYNPEWEK